MDDFTYLSLDRVGIARGGVSDLLELIDRSLNDPYWVDAYLIVRDAEDVEERPLYYVLGPDDVSELWSSANFDLTSLSRRRLFDMLDFGGARALPVEAGESPASRAVVVGEGGSIKGVWTEALPLGATFERQPWDEPETHEVLPSEPHAEPLPAPPSPTPDPFETWLEPVESPAAPPPAAPIREKFFRRTPHIDLSEEEPLQPRQEFVANVYLSRDETRPSETTRDVLIDLPDDLEVLVMEVTLVGSDHFEVKGNVIRPLSMNRDDARSPDVPFYVVVREDSPDTPAVLTARFTYKHRPSGRVDRGVMIEGVPEPELPPPDAMPAAADELAIDGRAKPADISVDVISAPANDGKQFLVTVRTTLVDDFTMNDPEPWSFDQTTGAVVAAMMDQFTLAGASAFARAASLKGAGSELWAKAPKSFRDLFWRAIDNRLPLRTIYVASEEPNIPWELMRPGPTRDDPTRKRRDPLGVEFAIGRWVHPGHRSPKQYEPIEDSYVIAPNYAVRPLKTAQDEAKWVCDQFSGEAVTPADHVVLDQKLHDRPVGLLHFVAHGNSAPPAPQTLQLDNNAIFNALQVQGMDGLADACLAKAPLVFLNACEIGRTVPSLVGAGGFASAFLTVGARCVIAPIWSVKDSIAHEVAVAFYEAALGNPKRPFADILRDIRARAYVDGGEDSYAAYCFYGDPLTTLEPAPA